jgi:peroxiredoxin
MSAKSRTIGITAAILLLVAIVALLILRRGADSDVLPADASTARLSLPPSAAGQRTANFVPKPYTGPALTGIVRTATGLQVAGAHVMVSTGQSQISVLLDGSASADSPGGAADTDADGRFTLQPNARPRGLFVRSPQGFAFALAPASPNAANSPPVQIAALILQPWGGLDATVSPTANSTPGSRFSSYADPRFGDAGVYFSIAAFAKPGAHIILDQVPSGHFSLAIQPAPTAAPSHWYEFQIRAGQTLTIQLGLPGRSVIGHVSQPLVAFAYRRATLLTAGSSTSASERLETTIDRDGTFHFDGVTPTDYRLNIQLGVSGSAGFEKAGDAQQSLTVPPLSASPDDKPIDIGEIKVNIPDRYATGQPAPPLTGTDAQGKSLSLSSFLGRYVLLSSITSTNTPAWTDVLALRAIHDRFANDPRIASLTACAGPSITQTRQAANETNVSWPLLDCGSSPDALPKQYVGVRHSVFVIDPKGVILGSNLDAIQAWTILDTVLKTPLQNQPPGISIRAEHLAPREADANASFKTIPAPSADDAATTATITVIDGALPDGPDPRSCLNDGRMPSNDDSRDQNFRFAIGSLEGRVRFDLGGIIPISEVRSYSWHANTRGPQLYRLFAADGVAPGFDPAPKIGADPTAHGWTLIANVDTRPPNDSPGGKYAVSISRPAQSLGSYRYLLFQMFPTEAEDGSGNTFYSEIDVIRQK